jgi:hypothetical protein
MQMITKAATKERPIIFSGEMVRAILGGRKTQTRRVIEPWHADAPIIKCMTSEHPGLWRVESLDPDGERPYEQLLCCPYGQPGERLWVRETWAAPYADHEGVPGGRKPEPGDKLVYRSKEADAYQWDGVIPWRPSIHMSRWASRVTLEITDVRVERVQEISADDALAEGIDVVAAMALPCAPDDAAQAEFCGLWDSINAKRGYDWDVNPWVWVIEFKVVAPRGAGGEG